MFEFDAVDWCRWFHSHSLVDGVNKLLIFFNFLHELCDSALIEESLVFVARLPHKPSSLLYLIFSLQNVVFKHIDFLFAVNINVLHNLLPGLHLLLLS